MWTQNKVLYSLYSLVCWLDRRALPCQAQGIAYDRHVCMKIGRTAHRNGLEAYDRIPPPCNYCHHPWCVGHKSYHKALLIMFSCDGISDHDCWNEVSHYWDTKLSCITNMTLQDCLTLHAKPILLILSPILMFEFSLISLLFTCKNISKSNRQLWR